jgi:signal transduction histidine kinase
MRRAPDSDGMARTGGKQPPATVAPASDGVAPSADAAASVPSRVPLHHLMSRFNIAFSLMSVIPLLTCFYLILSVRLFSLSILEGLNGIYFMLALVIALLGLLAGRRVIQDLILRLVHANQQLAQLNERQAAFVGNVAHEFRSPLGVFKGALDNLVDGLHGPLAQDQEQPVRMCLREVNRLTLLVGDLLDVTRIEAGKLPMKRQPVVLQEVLRAVEQLFHLPMSERGLRFTLELPEAPATVVGDQDRLQQVFINLVGNAMKFTEQGDVCVRLAESLDGFQIEVDDTGPGIPEEDLERIFDKFERVGDPSSVGSGLGLPIARDIVRLHHGHIWAERRPAEGSRFIVQLPKDQPGSVG